MKTIKVKREELETFQKLVCAVEKATDELIKKGNVELVEAYLNGMIEGITGDENPSIPPPISKSIH